MDFIDDLVGCYQELVEFLRDLDQSNGLPSAPGNNSIPALAVEAPWASVTVSPEHVAALPMPMLLVNATTMPQESGVLDEPTHPMQGIHPPPHHPCMPPPVTRPSTLWNSSGIQIGHPPHLPPNAVPMMSTHVTHLCQQPPRKTNSGKEKQIYREIPSGSEYEEDELELEEETEDWVIKEEPLVDHPGIQAYTWEAQIEMELEEEAIHEGQITQASAAKAPWQKVKVEPKTPAIMPDSDDEDTPIVIDQFAMAGENNPPCLNCIGCNVTCHYVVNEWVMQCKLCQ